MNRKDTAKLDALLRAQGLTEEGVDAAMRDNALIAARCAWKKKDEALVPLWPTARATVRVRPESDGKVEIYVFWAENPAHLKWLKLRVVQIKTPQAN